MPSHRHTPGCARLNLARLNAFRLNAYERVTVAVIGGVDRSPFVRIEGAGITHVLNDQPDTASVRVHGFTPVAGQPFTLTVGEGPEGDDLYFSGRLLETTVLYESRKEHVAYDLQAIDPTWLLNRQRVIAHYPGGYYAHHVIGDIMNRFTRGFGWTTYSTIPDIVLTEIAFTNETVATCLTTICERIGAYWYVDYDNELHVFLNETPDANPITDATPQGSSGHMLSEDLSQVVTRVVARGAGVGAAVDLAVGATEIPIDLGDQQNFYAVGGGRAEVDAQPLGYTGVRGLGGSGAIIGTGNAPTVAPTPTPSAGNVFVVGMTHGYAATFTTASGETLPGPLGAITIQTITMRPAPALTARSRGAGSSPPGMISPGASTIRFAVQIVYNGGAWGPLGTANGPYAWDGNDWEIYLGLTQPFQDGYYYPVLEPAGPVATVNHVIVYRSDDGQPFNSASSSSFSSGGGWVYQCCVGYSTGGVPPATGFGGITVKNIPVSTAPGVTGRKLYRTPANSGALKLLTTLANNTTTEFVDTIGDVSLGAAPPTLDTSTIQADGQVLAGATVLPVSSTIPFTPEIPGDAAGGWAQVGNLVIRYTGVGTGTLTGLPATGPGALSATVRYGAQVLRQPRLVGVTGVNVPIRKGDTVTLRVEVDDVAAQDAMAVRLGSVHRADGVIEEVFTDSRMRIDELRAYAQALLTERKDPRRTWRFVTRDPTVQVGRLVTANLASPPISGTFRVQRITFDEIAISGGLGRTLPRRTVEASNKLYTFADLLRRLRGREGGAG